MTNAPRILLGGTFDPIHYGHLRVADDVRAALAVDQVLLVPAADPPHRPPPGAPARDRVAMLELAVAQFPGLAVDAREVNRGGKSFTVDTLRELRREWPTAPLAWIVGSDTFLGLTSWHRYRELLDLAHLIVVARPGVDLAAQLHGELARIWNAHATADRDAIKTTPAGAIVTIETSPHAISATAIRQALASAPADRHALGQLLPAAVLAYIETHHLYGAVADAR